MDDPDKHDQGPDLVPFTPIGRDKWGGVDAEDESNISLLHARWGVPIPLPQHHAKTMDGPATPGAHGPTLLSSLGPGCTRSTTSASCSLLSLPLELLDNILSFLIPLDLVAVSSTCRALQSRTSSDHIWQPHVQANVPGVKVTTPSPCSTFRHLYASHDPRWFLPRHKIWFCDGRDLTGKLLIVRYDPRRGCIEGYQLLAQGHVDPTYHNWGPNDDVVIHTFHPRVFLHLDRPVLQLDAASTEIPLNGDDGRASNPSPSPFHKRALSRLGTFFTSSSLQGDEDGDGGEFKTDSFHALPRMTPNRFSGEVHMPLPHSNPLDMHSTLQLARALSPATVRQHASWSFPYGHMWPPPAVPARRRVAGANPPTVSRERQSLSAWDRPARRRDVCQTAFRMRSWHEFRPLALDETLVTYATLDPHLYAPTEDKPWRGIWVGDYSGHGCEFLLVHQPDDDDPDATQGEETVRQGGQGRRRAEADNSDNGPATAASRSEARHHVGRNGYETDAESEARKQRDAGRYRGRLEAIKLTGDPNVPRGEYTFVADDLGPGGFVRVCEEKPFQGARIVRSKGHIAGHGFRRDNFIESQLILISHDRLAQYWVGFGHISFFERVDIDSFLKPN